MGKGNGGASKRKNIEKGKSGVELRYYKKNEYLQLTDEQKRELKEWRENKKAKSGDSTKISALELQMQQIMDHNKALQQTIAALETKSRDKIPRDPLKPVLNQRGGSHE